MQVARRNKVLFSLPSAILEDAQALRPVNQATNPLSRLPLQHRGASSELLALDDMDECDGQNLLQSRPQAQDASSMQLAMPIDPFSAPAASVQSNPALFRGDVFWKPVAGNMHRHTVAGEPLQAFDFLAQTFRPCAGDATQVHVVPAGAPTSLRLEHVMFERLATALKVWKLCEDDGAGQGYLHSLRLSLVYISLHSNLLDLRLACFGERAV